MKGLSSTRSKSGAIRGDIDDTAASCLIEVANVLCNMNSDDLSSIEIIKSKEVESLYQSIKNGILSKSDLQKNSNASVFVSAMVKLIDESQKIFNQSQMNDIKRGKDLATILNGLPNHKKQLLGTLFGTLEVLSEHNQSNLLEISTKLSAALFDDNSSMSSPSDAFVTLASNSKDVLPYHLTFCKRHHKEPKSNPEAFWDRIIAQRRPASIRKSGSATGLPLDSDFINLGHIDESLGNFIFSI